LEIEINEVKTQNSMNQNELSEKQMEAEKLTKVIEDLSGKVKTKDEEYYERLDQI
jgi:FtsZ-binding cell division protein ZapB